MVVSYFYMAVDHVTCNKIIIIVAQQKSEGSEINILLQVFERTSNPHNRLPQ